MKLDPRAMQQFREMMEDDFNSFYLELIDTFLDNGPTLVAELKQAYNAADIPNFTRAAHTLKSNGNTFGATQMAALAFELEQIGILGDLSSAAGKVEPFEKEYLSVIEELKIIRSTL